MRQFLWFVPFDTRYLLAVDFRKWEDTNIEIKLCFARPEVSQLFRGNVTFQNPPPASVNALGFSSVCAGKTSTTLKEGREWGPVFEGYKTKCTCLLKLLFILTGLPKEILQDLEPWFSARKYFFSRQKWILRLFSVISAGAWEALTCRSNNQSLLLLDCPALANTWSNSHFVAILATNQPVIALCVLFLLVLLRINCCLYSDTAIWCSMDTAEGKGLWAALWFPNSSVMATVIHILKGKQTCLTDLWLLTVSFLVLEEGEKKMQYQT